MASPWERMKAGKSALPDSYRGAQPGGKGTMQMQKYMPTRGEISNINKNYQRGADIQKFVDKNIMYQTGLERGAKNFIGPDGIERLNLAGTGIKDPRTGATMLSMQTPSLTATAPTFGQFVGDVGRGLGSMIKGGFDFMTKGGITGALFQGAKDLFTQPIDTAKRIGYGAQDMMKGYDPFTKQGVGETQKITTEPLPSMDLEAKMSAYEDPIKYYAGKQKTSEPNVMVADAGDATQNYMNLLKNVQNLGKTPYGTFGLEDVLSSPKLTYEKEIGPGTLSGTIGDNKASLGYSMIFNKGGRVRGTGIMGALR
jgi:hypothetical protein